MDATPKNLGTVREAQTLIKERQVEVKQAFETPQWYFRRLNYRVLVRRDLVRGFVNGKPYRSMLDIGCGDGSISLPLLADGSQLVLLDISEAMLALARARVAPQWRPSVRTLAGDVMQAPLEPETFDLVICLGVLAYIDSAKPFLEKLASLLSPDGRLILECTDCSHPLTRLVRAYCRLTALVSKPAVRLAVHSSAQIVTGLQGLGLRLESAYRYSTPLPLIRKCFSDRFHYRATMALHGPATRNRRAWLGNECLFLFRKPPQNR